MAQPHDKHIKNRENFASPIDISATEFDPCPETAVDLINTYGTYNIQPTADNENDFPAIAQGNPKMAQRDPKFYRDGNDFNPASDRSDKHPLGN
jgi:hypothetical protein